MELLISLISGAIGGNVAGKVLKNYDMGTLLNSVVGIVGGGLGTSLIGMMGASGVADAAASGGTDIGSIVSSIASGGVGGGAVMVIVGVIKKMMDK